MTRVTFSSSPTGFEVRETRGGITRSLAVKRHGTQRILTLSRLSPPQEQAPDKRNTSLGQTFDLEHLTAEQRAEMRAAFTLPGDISPAGPESVIPKGFIEQPHSHPHRESIHSGPRPSIVGRRGDDFR